MLNNDGCERLAMLCLGVPKPLTAMCHCRYHLVSLI